MRMPLATVSLGWWLVTAALAFAVPSESAAAALGSPLTIGRGERRVITRKATLESPIVLRGNGELTVQNAEVTVTPGKGTPEAVIELHDQSRLVLKHATLRPPREEPWNLIIRVRDQADIVIEDSAITHLLDIGGNATFLLKRARVDGETLAIPSALGSYGLVRVSGQAQGMIEQSVVNALELKFSAGDRGVINDLSSGRVASWDSRDLGSVGMSVRILDTEIRPPTAGPFIRGWSITAPLAADLQVKRSSLGAFTFAGLEDTTFDIAGLEQGRPITRAIGRLSLDDVTVHHQWGFQFKNATAAIGDSAGAGLSLSGGGTILLKNSAMNLLDARGFTGNLVFDRAGWSGRGVLVGGNRFQVSGTVTIDPQLRTALVWHDTRVTRSYPADVGDITLTFTDENVRDLREGRTSDGATVTRSFFDSTVPALRSEAKKLRETAWVVIFGILGTVGVGALTVSFLALRRKQRYTRSA